MERWPFASIRKLISRGRAASLLLAIANTVDGGEASLKGKRVALKETPRTQWTAHDPIHVVGDTIMIDGRAFPVSSKSDSLRVATTPDGIPNTGVTNSNIPILTWTRDGARHEVQLRFSLDEKGVWKYRAENAWEFRVGVESIRLIDTDANGRYDAFGVDGFTTYDSPFVLPLAREFVVGSCHVQIESINPDGSSLKALITPIRAGASELAALVRINRWRAANGLPSVTYDPLLCEHCTAHADYLRRHSWSGTTDPHYEDAGAEGATPGGAIAAKRSVISKGSVAATLDGFLDTYYHRIPFMAPALERIGINEKPDDLTVIDVREGMEKTWPVAGGWPCPVFSPASGARDVPTAAVGEQPHEPVSSLGTRGLPLMVLFDFKDPSSISEFAGKLYERKGTKEVEVPTLSADPWGMAFIQGIVPAAKLGPRSQYRAVFTWTEHGKAATQSVEFTTR